jgi:hypothetical protein
MNDSVDKLSVNNSLVSMRNVAVEIVTVFFVFGSSQVQNSVRRPVILTDIPRGFPQSVQANYGTVAQIRPPPFRPTSFPIHHSLIILRLDSIQSDQLTTSVNN